MCFFVMLQFIGFLELYMEDGHLRAGSMEFAQQFDSTGFIHL